MSCSERTGTGSVTRATLCHRKRLPPGSGSVRGSMDNVKRPPDDAQECSPPPAGLRPELTAHWHFNVPVEL